MKRNNGKLMDSNPSVLKMFCKHEELLFRQFLIYLIHQSGIKRFWKGRLFERIEIWPETSIRNERIIAKHNYKQRKTLTKATKSFDQMSWRIKNAFKQWKLRGKQRKQRNINFWRKGKERELITNSLKLTQIPLESNQTTSLMITKKSTQQKHN